MKVICPKCQFENQADSMRVVCARCATIIDVRNDQGTGMDINGKRHSSRLPFSANPGNNPSNSQSNSQSLNKPQDVYATRIGDDFDDVLDIPRPLQTSYQTNYEPSPVFDDVFATPGYEGTEMFDYSSPQKPPTSPLDFNDGSNRQRETHDYEAAPEPEFMGWPVLPENAIDDDDQGGGFASNRGGLLARIVMGAIVFGGLVFGAYYFLGDLISKRKDQAQTLIAETTNPAAGGAAVGSAPVTQQPAAPANAGNSAASVPAAAVPPPVVTPPKQAEAVKPAPVTPLKDDKSAGNTSAKPVDIPPMTGRAGHSQATKPVPTVSVPNRGNLTLQVASYNDQSQANDRVARLKSAGVDASVVRAEIPGKGTWYRVQIGRFASREDAGSFGSQLRSRGVVQDFIVTTVGK